MAIADARRDPLLGDGAGGYRYSYSRHRDSTTQNVLDAHSVELETLSELGIPGLAMLLAAVGGAALGAYRTRALGPSAASLSLVVLAAAAYWFVHTSLDWFWPYPAVTAPVFCMLGCACAPGLMSPERPVRRTGRRWAGAALVMLALSAVPPYVSLRYLHSAYGEWQSDLGPAFADLDRARSFNPLALEPYLAEGAIARATGQRGQAIAAFTQAADKRPEDWAPHYFLASLYRTTAPRLATQELNEAQTLNPNEPAIALLRKRLEHPHGDG